MYGIPDSVHSMKQLGNQAVILGSTRGIRRLDATRSMPSSLYAVESSSTVLDWALSALFDRGFASITYLGGYQIQKVLERYPSLSYRYHSSWQQEGELAGLLTLEPDHSCDCFILRSSIFLLPGALARMAEAEGDVAVGYYTPGSRDEFVGIVAIRKPHLGGAYTIAKKIVAQNPKANLEQWVDGLASEGLHISKVDLDGLAAPIGDRLSLVRTLFSSKAQTLARIRPLVRRATVLDQVTFSVADWEHTSEQILDEVGSAFGPEPVVVRSSARSEDGLKESMAGRFRSVLGVTANEKTGLKDAIEQVIHSYASNGRTICIGDEVFIQPQANDLAASGVLLTRDPETGAPYYVLNIDRVSGLSNTVTSGSQTAFDTVYVSRWAGTANLPQDVGICVSIARELEELMHVDSLDIELGIDRSHQAYIFQVRPIPTRACKFQLADEDLEEEMDGIRKFLEGYMRPHPHLHGNTALFSTMSDWNPAEMIGTSPRHLALSLYQKLIGNQAWAKARSLIGYRDVRPQPLIVSLGGRPYVDVRASLNSFLPEGLESGIAEKWVEHGLDLLQDNPWLHDKVEFEVALPCLTLDGDGQADRLAHAGLTKAEINRFHGQLLTLTDRILLGEAAPIDQQLALLKRLEPGRERTLASEETNVTYLAHQIRYLLEECEHFGVVPFSVLARYAFIAIAFLRSLRDVGVFSSDEYETILRSIPTVATDLAHDLKRYASGQLTREVFLAKYGHLRPSSYDITSANYVAAMDLYLSRNDDTPKNSQGGDPGTAMELFDDRKKAISTLLREQGFMAQSHQLRDFIINAIPTRETAKFEFMKNINAALELIARLGEQLGIDREEMSFLPLERIISAATDSPSGATTTQLRREIEFAKKRWNLTSAIRLPHLVRTPEDVDAFQLEAWSPNFVSRQRIVAPPVVLDGSVATGRLAGKIVLVRAADPGYDWIFGHAIAGLVTQFGGVASHMAIRAAEFGLPAAIGCGELIFERLMGAELIELDCGNRRVNTI